MSLLYEQVESVRRVGDFLNDLRFGPRMKQKELRETIRRLTRHYPMSAELEIWHKWLLASKGHE